MLVLPAQSFQRPSQRSLEFIPAKFMGKEIGQNQLLCIPRDHPVVNVSVPYLLFLILTRPLVSYAEDQAEQGRSYSPVRSLKTQVRDHPDPSVPFIPTLPSEAGGRAQDWEDALPVTGGHVARSITPTMTEDDEGLPGSPRSGVSAAPTVVSPHAPHVVAPSEPSELGPEDADRGAIHERIGEIERQIQDTSEAARQAEEQREAEFRRNEEAREQAFQENEARRENTTQDFLRELEYHPELGALPVPPPGGFGGPVAEGDATSLRPPSEAPAHSMVETMASAVQDASARYSEDLKDIVDREREAAARERAELQERLDQARAEKDRQRDLLDEERLARIAELEAELARCREDSANEKQMRAAEEEERHEAEIRERQERDDALRQQLVDITDILQQQRDDFARKKELMDLRLEDKDRRRENKDRQWNDLYSLVESIINDREAEKERAQAERDAAEGKPSKSHALFHCFLVFTFSPSHRECHRRAQKREWRTSCTV